MSNHRNPARPVAIGEAGDESPQEQREPSKERRAGEGWGENQEEQTGNIQPNAIVI